MYADVGDYNTLYGSLNKRRSVLCEVVTVLDRGQWIHQKVSMVSSLDKCIIYVCGFDEKALIKSIQSLLCGT